MALKVAIVDFDGTLVESVGIKDRAFEELFAERPELPAILAFHLSHNHMIRFEKFRRITTDILGEQYTPEREAQLAAAFSGLVFDAIAQAPEVSGASELLDRLDGAGVRTYVVSMSPKDEFARILEERGLSGRFAGVYTHPWTKPDALADILRRECVAHDEAVMVGDAPEDAAAAETCGVPFIGRDSGRPFPPEVTVFADMHGVLSMLGPLLRADGDAS